MKIHKRVFDIDPIKILAVIQDLPTLLKLKQLFKFVMIFWNTIPNSVLKLNLCLNKERLFLRQKYKPNIILNKL